MVIGIAILWYLFLTPTGALRRTVLFDYPKEAFFSKIQISNSEYTGKIYHFSPNIHDENGKILSFGCSESDFIYKCSAIYK